MSLNSLARSALRLAFKGRTFARRLPADFGHAAVYVAPESRLKNLRPGLAGLDARLLSWAKTFVKPGDAVWDIGANAGVFGFAAAARGAEVLAIEPDPFLAATLMRSREANPTLNLTPIACAVSDERGLATLQIASGGREANALAQFAGSRDAFGRSLGEIVVPTVPLDDLLAFSHPKLVKIDVEGAEVAALRGATKLLNEVRPLLIIESSPENAPKVGELLKAADYEMFDADTDGERGPRIDTPAFNTLAVPLPR